MSEHKTETRPSRVKPFVKKGATLGFAKDLKEKGLWPPRLHDRKDHNNNDKKPTATPFLIIPASTTDNGTRPLPNSEVFHSPSIWLEDTLGNMIATPVVGNTYFIKCRIINLGAFASYGGLVDFYLEKPSVFNALAGTTGSLPAFGRSGFSILPGNYIDIKCPTAWNPVNQTDLEVGILVQAFDPFTDMWTSKFDARNDRHVGRHDLTSDFYVRDWTLSSSLHDSGAEPSADPQFYLRSDVWNRRSSNPGSFVNDQATNQDPQAGNGAAGDNFMFARISRNNASTTESVKAHFLFAEFGTGSPYINCSPSPDPSVTFLPGETTKLISQPWHLHPSSSTHLCIAVQVYSDADTFMPPGLLGYTPGWPTTDLMVINDNNKAQRNINVWDGVPEEPGMHFAMIFNSATFIRDFELSIIASDQTIRHFTNAKVMVHGSDRYARLSEKSSITIPNMLPGERRWIVFSYDSFTPANGESMQIMFNELSGSNILNGFGMEFRALNKKEAVPSLVQNQLSAFTRMESMQIKSAEKGIALCRRILEDKSDQVNYFKSLPEFSHILLSAVTEMSAAFGGLKDEFGVLENARTLSSYKDEKIILKAIAHHQMLLNQLDAWQTTVIKSRGDEASVLFTVRLQKELYSKGHLFECGMFHDFIKETNGFISNYSMRKVTNKEYPEFMNKLIHYFNLTVEMTGNKILNGRLKDLQESLHGSVPGIQKTHLAFLNDLQIILQKTIHSTNGKLPDKKYSS